ncbi:MAG TPA: 3D domain-containing protein [Tepidisphaeraceae bacterium]|nr:3D domain-containing protein [Tepidisphaeraceae bacterium]
MDPLLPLPTDRTIRHSRVRLMEVTAYCPCSKCCGPNAQGITASGKHVSYNHGKFVAADTRILPFGTRLLIPGYAAEPVEVIDRGGAIKGNKLDVFFPTHEQALKWGRQKMVPVIIVE